MSVTDVTALAERMRPSWVGLAGVLALVALSGVAAAAGLWKVLAVGWVAFLAMAGAAVFGARAARADRAVGGAHGSAGEAIDGEANTTHYAARADTDARRLVWGYGLASGAMVTSAAVFLLPQAIGYDPRVGGFGVAAGLLSGFAGHTIGHRLAHRDLPLEATAAQLTAHSLAAGLVIGSVYATLPDLGLLLGVAIVSHKAPAGYAAARRLSRDGVDVRVLGLPAAGVGVAAIPVGLFGAPVAGSGAAVAAVFGFAAGIFLHVAMDFLPACEAGGDVGEVAALSTDAHALLDRLRVHAVASISVGALAVVFAWLAVG
jgi:ZIP family zinc transporter